MTHRRKKIAVTTAGAVAGADCRRRSGCRCRPGEIEHRCRIADKLVDNKASPCRVGAAGQDVVAAPGGIRHLLRVAEKLVDIAGAVAVVVAAGQGVVASLSGVDDRHPASPKSMLSWSSVPMRTWCLPFCLSERVPLVSPKRVAMAGPPQVGRSVKADRINSI